MINYDCFEQTIFEFDMNALYIEQELIQNEINNRYNLCRLNEAEGGIIDKIGETISKIFDNICQLIDKAIMNIRKSFQNVSFNKVKDKIDKIRKSTNDPKDMTFELLKPTIELPKSSVINTFTPESVGVTNNGNIWTYDIIIYDKIKQYSSRNKKTYADGYATSYVIKKMGNGNVNYTDCNGWSDVAEKIIKDTEKIKVDKSNCRNQTGYIEQEYDELQKFMNGEFGKCITALSKLKQESRKLSIKAKTSSFYVKEAKNNILFLVQVYQYLIRNSIKYLFSSTSFHISCLNKNVNNMANILL